MMRPTVGVGGDAKEFNATENEADCTGEGQRGPGR